MGFAHAIAESVSISLLISTLWQPRAYSENKKRGSRFLFVLLDTKETKLNSTYEKGVNYFSRIINLPYR